MSGIELAGMALGIGFIIVLVARWLNPVSAPDRADRSNPSRTDVTDPKLIAIITAVLVAAQGKSIRVKRIRYLQQPPLIAAWNEIGRSQLFQTHQINRIVQ